MSKRLRPAFVVTLSAVTVATAASCSSNEPDTDGASHPTISRNPPEMPDPIPTATETATATEMVTATASASTSATAPITTAQVDHKGRKIMNAMDAKGRTVFANGKDGCYVELPFPPLKKDEQRPPGTPPPRVAVGCPPIMKDPLWAKCAGGTLTEVSTGSCECFVMGNPPPPPRPSDCPSK